MEITGNILNIHADPFEVDVKRIWVWEVWFTDAVTKLAVKRGTLRTLDRKMPPDKRSWDGVPYKLVFANTQNMQAWYARQT